MRIALRLEYDGTDFHGSQLQASERTVQAELETAFEKLFQQPVRPHLASRTDAGVHARDQVAAINVQTELEMTTIRDALNYHLPRDIAVRSVARVSDEFDPRGHAVSREYAYSIDNSPVQSPLSRRFAANVSQPLDADRMDEAAAKLVGTHDFASFAGPAVPRDASTLRNMQAASVSRDGDRITLRFKANAFLHQQIRRMAGALVEAGKSPDALQTLRELLASPARGARTKIMPPQGLCLIKIEYPQSGHGALPAA